MARGFTSCQVRKSMLGRELAPLISKHSEAGTLSAPSSPHPSSDKARDPGHFMEQEIQGTRRSKSSGLGPGDQKRRVTERNFHRCGRRWKRDRWCDLPSLSPLLHLNPHIPKAECEKQSCTGLGERQEDMRRPGSSDQIPRAPDE